jgi:hypothetical protein
MNGVSNSLADTCSCRTDMCRQPGTTGGSTNVATQTLGVTTGYIGRSANRRSGCILVYRAPAHLVTWEDMFVR